MKKIYKLAVCGTGFGSFYAEAASQKPESVQLSGIVAKGSERSIRCAKHYEVPLYKSIDELPEDIDIVCVAVRTGSLGGKGTELALQLLQRGISVILEQPVHHDELKQCYKAAIKGRACFMTGNLYVNMPEIKRMLSVADMLKRKGANIEYISAGSSVQAFYPFAEIINRLLPAKKISLEEVSENAGGFKHAYGRIGEIPFLFEYGNQMDPEDPDNHMQLLHRFSIYYDAGRLELTDTRGPLLWYPRLNMPWSVLSGGGFPEKYPEHMYEQSVQVLSPDINLNKPYYKFVEDSWVECIGEDIDKMILLINDQKEFLMKAQQEQKDSRLWNSMTATLGYAVLKTTGVGVRVTEEDIKKAAEI